MLVQSYLVFHDVLKTLEQKHYSWNIPEALQLDIF